MGWWLKGPRMKIGKAVSEFVKGNVCYLQRGSSNNGTEIF
jgi:hypothetical protein